MIPKRASCSDRIEACSLVLNTFSDARELTRFSLVSKSWYQVCNQVWKVRLDLRAVDVTITTNPEDERIAMEKLGNVVRSALKNRQGLVELEIAGDILAQITAKELMNNVLAPSKSTLRKLVLNVNLTNYIGFFQSISANFPGLEHLETSLLQFPSFEILKRMRPQRARQYTSLKQTHLRVLKVNYLRRGSIETILKACPELHELVADNVDGGVVAGMNNLKVLSLSGFRGDNGILDLESLPLLTNLRVELFREIKLGDAPLKNLKQCSIEDDIYLEMLETLIRRSPCLEKLEARLRHEGLIRFHNLSSCLKDLRLSFCISSTVHLQNCDGLTRLELLSAGSICVKSCNNLSHMVMFFKGHEVSVEYCGALATLEVTSHGTYCNRIAPKVQVLGCRRLNKLAVKNVDVRVDEASVMELETLYLLEVHKLELPRSLPSLKALLVTQLSLRSDIHEVLLAAGSCLANLIDREAHRFHCEGVAEWIGKPVRKVKIFPGSMSIEPALIPISQPEDELHIQLRYEYGTGAIIGWPSMIMENMPDVEEICVFGVYDSHEDDLDSDEDEDNESDEEHKVRDLMDEVRPGFFVVERGYGESGDMIFRRK